MVLSKDTVFDRQKSVIVPVYNSDTTIRRCIESLLCQSENIEMVLVDDGSEDLSNVWKCFSSRSNNFCYKDEIQPEDD